MNTIFTQQKRLLNHLNREFQTNGPLAWGLIVLFIVAFLLPYFIFRQLFTTIVTYGGAALVPLCLAAYLRGRHGMLMTWGVIVFGISCSLWKNVGLIWPSTVINNFVLGNGTGLLAGLTISQFFRMHHQIVTSRLATQALAMQADQKQQAYELQRQLSDLKDQLILNLSHEFRTPLTEMYGYLELLGEYRQRLDEEQQISFITHARRGCTELLELISNLLDANQIEKKKLNISLEPIPIAQFVQEVVDHSDPRVRKAYEIDQDMPKNMIVHANRQYLRQILRNLISNALKYSPPHSRIVISSRLIDSDAQEINSFPHVCISVKDEGPGIPPEDIPLLFNKFTRLKRDLAGSIRGTGLGLYISKQLVEAMHGRIWVESVGKIGEGSRFCFLLPSASPDRSPIEEERMTTV